MSFGDDTLDPSNIEMSKFVRKNLVRYIAEEVQRQHARPIAVFWMLEAWIRAERDFLSVGTKGHAIPSSWIEQWGSLVEPEKNDSGWRKVRVFVGGQEMPPAMEVPRLMEALCNDILKGLDPDAAYYRFQKIHPFVDGNGRTGKILYNYMKGRLHDPVMPPNFFGCANP